MILAVVVFAFLLRVISLNQSFWLDEATSGLVVRNFSLIGIITKFSPGDFHPPLYYLILKIWSYIFGTNEIALRFPSIIFGLLTVYLVYRIALLITVHPALPAGRRSQFTAIIAALLLATSGLHVYYSQEARMYSLVTLLISLLVYLFLKKKWLIFSIILMLVGLTDYPALLIIPVFWILAKKDWKKLAISHLPLAVGFFLWLPVFYRQLSIGFSINESAWSNLLGTFSFKNFALIPVKFILGRISFDDKYIYASVVLVAVFLFGYLILKSTRLKSTRRVDSIIWLWLVVPIFLGMIISFRLSIFSYFRFLFCLPAFYLLVAVGLEKLKPKISNILIIVLVGMNLTFSGIYLFTPRFQREGWRGLTSFIKNESEGNTAVTLFVADSNMEAYKYYDSKA
ncbi:MAG: glycosyltransferase family 39 protein, partial [Candidatus Woesebacteria bacterium]|nr:glycosyltransferase family 39 protein [Candidatus Woesebacteria bacterium]